MSYQIRPALSQHDLDQARALMRRYATRTGIDLCFQNFDAELAALPGKYATPDGNLWLAVDGDDNAAGTIAVRPLADGVCEMKRLWVEHDAQGHGLGRELANTAIEFAVARGYREMKLDTLQQRMPAAIAMYRSLGFVDCEPYTPNPEPDVLYLVLDLDSVVRK